VDEGGRGKTWSRNKSANICANVDIGQKYKRRKRLGTKWPNPREKIRERVTVERVHASQKGHTCNKTRGVVGKK